MTPSDRLSDALQTIQTYGTAASARARAAHDQLGLMPAPTDIEVLLSNLSGDISLMHGAIEAAWNAYTDDITNDQEEA